MELQLKLKKRKGLTLMELLIVLGIIVVLIALSSGADWADEYSRYTTTKADMDTIVEGIKTYESMRRDKKLPASLGDLIIGVPKAQSKSDADTGRLVAKEGEWTTDPSTFKDQWDEAYIYDPASRTLTSNNNGGDPIVRNF